MAKGDLIFFLHSQGTDFKSTHLTGWAAPAGVWRPLTSSLAHSLTCSHSSLLMGAVRPSSAPTECLLGARHWGGHFSVFAHLRSHSVVRQLMSHVPSTSQVKKRRPGEAERLVRGAVSMESCQHWAGCFTDICLFHSQAPV